MAEAKKTLTLVYLGPSAIISPGQDKDGKPEPFIKVGDKITLSEAQVLQLEQLGHQFEGRQTPAGSLLRGADPGAWEPPHASVAFPAPPDTVPLTPSVTTYGGQRPATPEQQEELVADYNPRVIVGEEDKDEKKGAKK